MAFIAGAVIIGGAAIYAGGHDDYSDYHSRHSNHRQYGDSALRNQISRKENAVSNKESDVESLRRRMNDNFNSRIKELKREGNYPTFYSADDSSPSKIIKSVKADMRRELDAEIARDKQELEAIDKMIARINELELQSKG